MMLQWRSCSQEELVDRFRDFSPFAQTTWDGLGDLQLLDFGDEVEHTS